MTGELLALGAGLCFACGSLLARSGSDALGRKLGLIISLCTNALVILLVGAGYIVWSGWPGVSLVGIACFALGGVTGTLLGRWAWIASLERLGPSRAALYKNAQPVLTTVLAISLLREPFSTSGLLGGALIMAGVLAASHDAVQPVVAAATWGVQTGQRRLGITLGLLSATGFAVGNTLRKVGIEAWPEPVLGAAVGVAVAVLGSVATGGAGSLRLRGLHRGHLHFALFGVCNAGAQLLFFSSLLLTPVWIANVFVSMEPVLTILLSVVLFRGREQLGRGAFASAALVVAGSVLIVAV